jgi:polysaccharide export outer membrane protein
MWGVTRLLARAALLACAGLLACAVLAAQEASQPGYVIGAGDQIRVQVLDLEEINDRAGRPIPVDMRGNITLPYVGRLHVAGLTTDRVEAEIRERLKGVLKEPEVTVMVVEFASKPVSVLGAVKNPGVHQISGQKTLTEILSLAGGMAADAGNSIKITRRKESGPLPLQGAAEDPTGRFFVGAVNLRSLMEARSPEDNILIQPNDVISVPKADLVYVIGAVKRSGGFVLNEKENITVLQALSLAEGLDRFAAKNKAKILRPVAGTQDRTEIPMDLKPLLAGKSKDVPLQANDVLFIPISGGKQAASRTVDAAIGVTTGLIIYRR